MTANEAPEAGVPEKVEFATRIVLARRMLERALEHHLPCARVTADCVYGDEYHLRRFLTEHSIPSVLAVHPQNQIRMGLYEGFASVRIDEWFARKHRGPWDRLSAGWGSKGPRWFDWAWRKMDGDVPEGWQA